MILVKYFSKYRESIGVSEERYSAGDISSLADLLLAVSARHPQASAMLDDKKCILALNHEVVSQVETALKVGDEVAFYPPVTGG
jgi:molybdopterin synthase sulfur carrier subunit